MTYFSFLAVFIAIPILILATLAAWDKRLGRSLPAQLSAWSYTAAITVHILVAVVYTTPWDNFLVAHGVWAYDPQLVTGWLLGWVPVEEYIFFLLQTTLVGLWIVFLGRRMALPETGGALRAAWRWIPIIGLGIVWFASLAGLASDWLAGTYLCLELGWALPPIMLQLAFGGDILRHYSRLVLAAILPIVIYLSAVDGYAIGSGIWTIQPTQSLGIFIAGLPVEELVFFLLTTTLITFGVLLLISFEGQTRLRRWLHVQPFKQS